MTKEQYKSELGVIESKIKQLASRKAEIREAFLKANAKFKVGDKVVVIYDEHKHPWRKDEIMPERRVEAYIGDVEDKYYTASVNYDFKKVKKDGTMSGQSAGIYGNYDRIELITPAPLTPTN